MQSTLRAVPATVPDPFLNHDLMLRFAVCEDGRLHSEKYYRTVTEEFATTRPAFRWRHLVALARVMASMYRYDRKDRLGHRAPGYEQACKLLGVGCRAVVFVGQGA